MTKKEYAAPYTESIELESVGCIMASTDGNLGDLDETTLINDILGDNFIFPSIF